ncbi:MAG: hypothetical protein KA715_06345 [Xanthomonadaceae bacterium]|nr:hypothetical protein [Xanthomonadaceae bacterium]
MASLVQRICVCAVLFSVSACGILIGNVKPVAEKSETYGILDLTNEDPDWSRVDSVQPQQLESDAKDDGSITDVSFQSKKTASTITLNSTCRDSLRLRSQSLSSYTKSLFLGLSNIDYKEEKETLMIKRGVPALQTTVRGKLNNEPVMLRAIVFKNDNCLYDLLYVARPQFFKTQEAVFKRFSESLTLR